MIKIIKGNYWNVRPSGLITMVGGFIDVSERKTESYLETKLKSDKVRELYRKNNITLGGSLKNLTEIAKKVWEKWFCCRQSELTPLMLFKSHQLNRIANCILLLEKVPRQKYYLRRILKGSLDIFSRSISHGKDTLWELEVWKRMKINTPNVFLEDPPDVIIKDNKTKVSVACKKLYSESHVQNVLSKGVKEVTKSENTGAVAINIDDLIPPDVLIQEAKQKNLTTRLVNHISTFIRKHERHMRKYLDQNRLIAIIVSMSVIADVKELDPRINVANQWLVWTTPELRNQRSKELQLLYKACGNAA